MTPRPSLESGAGVGRVGWLATSSLGNNLRRVGSGLSRSLYTVRRGVEADPDTTLRRLGPALDSLSGGMCRPLECVSYPIRDCFRLRRSVAGERRPGSQQQGQYGGGTGGVLHWGFERVESLAS